VQRVRDGRPLLAFFGHHKCASSWITDIVAAVCAELGLRQVVVHADRDFGHDLQAFVDAQRADWLIYSNADWSRVQGLRSFRGFHVVRDPRDISVSAYYSHLYSHGVDAGWPELADYREQLKRLPKDEGLLAEIVRLRAEVESMRTWDYGDARILELKMEDLTADPYPYFLRIFEFLGLVDDRRLTLARRALYAPHKAMRVLGKLTGLPFPSLFARLPAERVLGIVWENDFRKKAGGRRQGEEDTRSHYRKGVAGDWKNHFKAEHRAYFERHYRDALEKLGYERAP
jgi:hypothetical protein